MAVKTILIGMGSFGHDVCNTIAQRIEAEYGSLDRIPWLRFMVYETEQQTKSFIAHRGLVQHMGIDPVTFGNYLQRPGQYDVAIKFTEWAKSETLNTIKQGDVPVSGANNSRPTGRLCFVDQTNSHKFEDQFRRVYNELVGLTVADTLRAMGKRPEEESRFRFAGVSGRDTIRVCVIGSLAGGTNSGSFVDVGYFLQTLQGVEDRLEVHGYGLIPNQAYVDKVHWGNVYAALTELNHFVGGKTYKAKFAQRPAETVSELTPYQRFFVLQSLSGSNNVTQSIEPVQNSLAEMLYLYSVTDPEENIQNTLVNAFGQYGGERDYDGRPMGYGTAGASVVVFPVDHIIDGLAARLASEALEAILETKSVPESEVKGYASKLAINQDTYNNRMLKHPTVEAFLVQLGQATAAAARAALKGQTSELDNVSVRIRGGIATAESGSSQNFQGDFRNPIAEVSQVLADERVAELDQDVARFVRNPNQGVDYVIKLLDGLKIEIEQRLSELQNPDTDIHIHTSARVSSEKMKRLRTELDEKKGCNPFAKKRKPEEVVSEWEREANSCWSSSLLISSEVFEKDTLLKLQNRIGVLSKRLTDPTSGLRQFLRNLSTELDKIYRQKNSAGPVVNGLCLFEGGKTLGEEWNRFLPDAKSEGLAREQILREVNSWFDELTKPRDLSPYDRTRNAEFRDVEMIARSARVPFASLRKETVERRLVAWTNWQAELNRAVDLGKVFLSVDPARNPLGIPPSVDPVRRPSMIYFHNPTSADKEASDVSEVLKRHNRKIATWDDPHRILIVEGLVGFSLYSIHGVSQAEAFFEPKRNTREDVIWQKLSGKPLDDQERFNVGLILAAFALRIVQRSYSGALTFKTLETPMHPAREFEVCPDGDLADGSYRLSKDKLASQDLKSQVEGLIREVGVEKMALELTTFNRGVEEWSLKLGKVSVTNQEAFLRELDFLRTIPGLLQAIAALYPAFNPNEGNWVKGTNPNVPSSIIAYRCSRCFTALAPEHQQAPKDLPEVCPNASCGQQIRFDRIFGLQ